MSELYGDESPVLSPAQPATTRSVKYILYFYVDPEFPDLEQVYNTKINEHNESILLNSHPDSGFDLFVPDEQRMEAHRVNKVDLKVKCKMVKVNDSGMEEPSAFYMYPRSSISKQNVRLANNVGIIDSGYRGNLCGMFDVIYRTVTYVCEKHTRLLQICTPTLEPFRIVKVCSDSALGTTHRGEGGFGSTGLRS